MKSTPPSPSRRSFLAGVGASALAYACRGAEESPAVVVPSRKPDFLLVTLCSARADRVGVLGYGGRLTTPSIDALASRGVAFRRAWANATWTNASHASILTGLTPGHHRLYDDDDALVAGAPTLPGLLAEQGWRTAALLQERGQMSLGPRCDVLRDISEIIENHKLADWSPDPLVQWATSADTPFFAMVHLREAHLPFGDGRPFIDPAMLPEALLTWQRGVSRPGVPGMTQWDKQMDPHRWLGEQMAADPSLKAALDLVYDSGMAYADASLKKLLEAFNRAGRLSNIVVVVVGDHGDCLIGHKGVLERSVVHVPMVIALPDGRGAGRVVEEHVAQFDILPTLLELAGVPLPKFQDGTSLMPVFDGASPPDRAIVIQSLQRVDGRIERRESAVRGELRVVQQSDDRYDVERGLYDDRVIVERPIGAEGAALIAQLRDLTSNSWLPTDAQPVAPEIKEAMRKQGYW